MSANVRSLHKIANGEFLGADNQRLLHGYEYVIEHISIGEIVHGDSPRLSGESDAHIRLLVELSGDLPLILVNRRTMRVIDGLHRVAAAKLRGESTMEAVLVDLDEREAFLLAVQANAEHGLPLTRADRNAAAERLITSYPGWSDRSIARTVGLAPGTVGAIRERSTGQIGQLNTRAGLDGRLRPAGTTEARRRAAEIIRARPDTPLRQVAKESGLSLGTAHDVRQRLCRGQSPVPGGEEITEPPAAPRQSRNRGRARSRNGGGEVSWPSVRHQVVKDPTIRYADWGRAFVQWLDANAGNCGEWKHLVDNIPRYWVDVMIDVAFSCRDEWQDFALALERRKSDAP
ncbi:ParB N-terminal domain-containing protein [Actinomadura sp. 9N215]|uniref:ParB N-terminal domain-containing protein n=1 Tax=Actinomadura sp. 9N215 TaxID=3375150 RepID=UPI00379ABFDD